MVWQAWENATGAKNNRLCFEEDREGEAGFRAVVTNAIQFLSFLNPRLAQLPCCAFSSRVLAHLSALWGHLCPCLIGNSPQPHPLEPQLLESQVDTSWEPRPHLGF